MPALFWNSGPETWSTWSFSLNILDPVSIVLLFCLCLAKVSLSSLYPCFIEKTTVADTESQTLINTVSIKGCTDKRSIEVQVCGEDGTCRKGITNFSCCYLAVDISWYLASCCAEQPDRVHDTEQEKIRAAKAKSKKSYSIYISCNYWRTNFVFHQITYLAGATGWHVTRW